MSQMVLLMIALMKSPFPLNLTLFMDIQQFLDIIPGEILREDLGKYKTHIGVFV